MRHILSLGHRSVLQQFAWSNVVLAFDYDGTLAPIVSDPEKAVMRPRTRALMEQLTKLYPCIVISGRGHGDALRRVRGVGIFEVVGNHGMEPWAASRRFMERVARWRAKLVRLLSRWPGVRVEDKGFSLAIHYRQSREKKKARAAILRAAAALESARIIGGKQVVNVLPLGAPLKGLALERGRARLRCDTALYLGDDETDEDVFALDQPGRLLSIRVGASRRSLAHYYIRSQGEVDRLLRELIRLRRSKDDRLGVGA